MIVKLSSPKEEGRLRMFKSKLLRIIFGAKRDKVTEGWGELHNEKPHNSYLRQML